VLYNPFHRFLYTIYRKVMAKRDRNNIGGFGRVGSEQKVDVLLTGLSATMSEVQSGDDLEHFPHSDTST